MRAELYRQYRRYELIGTIMGWLSIPGLVFLFCLGLFEAAGLTVVTVIILTASQIALIWSDIKCRQIEAKMRRMRRDTVRRYQFHD